VSRHRPLPEPVVQFRMVLIDAVWPPGGVGYYLDADRVVGTCPLCGDWLAVRFHGHAARADMDCHSSCTEPELADVLDLRVRP
jgi:hypothetical protein